MTGGDARRCYRHACPYFSGCKGNASPIITFVNVEEILASIERDASKQGMKLEPTQADGGQEGTLATLRIVSLVRRTFVHFPVSIERGS